MASFFSSPTAAEKKIDAATSDHIAEPPLDTYLELAEDIRTSPDAGQSYLKAIRKRLQSKSSHTVFLTLHLLDVAVKNGGDAFHESVSNPEFLNTIATVGTTAKERHVSDMALSLLSQWARAFPAQGLMSYADVYNKLKNKGVAFPDSASSSAAPVFTPPVNLAIHAPPRQIATSRAPDRSPNRSPNKSPNRSPSRSPRLEEKEPVSGNSERNPLSWASPFYVDKIKTESLQVIEYLQLFQQLIAAEPASAAAVQQLKANESVQSLLSTIVDCRGRVSRLLAEIEDETLMDLMIQLNDSIRLSIDYYEERLKGRSVVEPVIVVPTVLRKAGEGERKEGKDGKEDSGEQSVGGGRQQQPGDDPFDALANRPQQQQQRPQQAAVGSAAIQQPAGAGGAGDGLSQFDPLA